jgi:hypothetical protein
MRGLVVLCPASSVHQSACSYRAIVNWSKNTMGRKRLRSPKRGNSPSITAAIHARLATEIPEQADVAQVVLDDPLERGAKIYGYVNTKGDPLRMMHCRGQIDDAKFAAGRHWQRLYEEAEIGSIRGADTTKEPVDGGGWAPELMTDRRKKAVLSLIRCKKILGVESEHLLRQVLVFNKTIAGAGEYYGLFTEWKLGRLSDLFKGGLELLAKEFNYA